MCESKTRQADDIEAAAIEAVAFLSVNIGEAVPLRDYLASVEIFASALGLDLPRENEG